MNYITVSTAIEEGEKLREQTTTRIFKRVFLNRKRLFDNFGLADQDETKCGLGFNLALKRTNSSNVIVKEGQSHKQNLFSEIFQSLLRKVRQS